MPAKYEALRRKGFSKTSAAKITNAQAKPGDPIVTSAGEGYKKKKPNHAAKKVYPNLD
jgi:hypothetical protein